MASYIKYQNRIRWLFWIVCWNIDIYFLYLGHGSGSNIEQRGHFLYGLSWSLQMTGFRSIVSRSLYEKKHVPNSALSNHAISRSLFTSVLEFSTFTSGANITHLEKIMLLSIFNISSPYTHIFRKVITYSHILRILYNPVHTMSSNWWTKKKLNISVNFQPNKLIFSWR